LQLIASTSRQKHPATPQTNTNVVAANLEIYISHLKVLQMATQQDQGGVPFSVAHQFQPFRLLELPQEIVELIDAPNPPL
jgi:hypothetical protein